MANPVEFCSVLCIECLRSLFRAYKIMPSVYFEQLKYVAEKNWANYIQGLRHTYNLPLSDDVRQMTLEKWKAFVKTVIWDEAFM